MTAASSATVADVRCLLGAAFDRARVAPPQRPPSTGDGDVGRVEVVADIAALEALAATSVEPEP